MQNVKAALKMALFALWTLSLIIPQMLVLCFTNGQAAFFIPRLWHKVVCKIFGIKLSVEGAPLKNVQTLYVANHLSYLDIPVIANVLSASFVAKKDVASWAVFGFLSKLQQTAFIERTRGAAEREKNALAEMIGAGKSLIIFPEGTSTDGREVLPFKSSLFSLVLEENTRHIMVQPFKVSLSLVNDQPPLSQEERDIYAWHRDMTTELPAHLWRFAQNKGALITLKFHAPLRAAEFSDRKALAKTCHERVSMGLEKPNHISSNQEEIIANG